MINIKIIREQQMRLKDGKSVQYTSNNIRRICNSSLKCIKGYHLKIFNHQKR
jgi:uncharacterized Fe-S cluster protein YjdI